MKGKKRWYSSWKYWVTLALLISAGGVGLYEIYSVKADKPTYLTGVVEKGDIVLQVASTGTLAAVTTVQVGTQVSGTISELYADFNSEVKKGQVLAKLNPELFQAQVEQQEANVRAAEAGLNDDRAAISSAKANLAKARVDVIDKQRKLGIQRNLWKQGLIARDDLDTAQAALEASIAAEEAQQAQVDSAEARFKADSERLGQARAALSQAKVNLEHTIITSPISGIIISRNVDVGQTVAASFSSPTLFVIGEDLTQMKVETNIDEADVGKIETGMEAVFTVDAFPGEEFRGTINQIRLAAATVQNVVTYAAMIGVSNPDLKLRPGMTANVKIIINKADDVLKIPNSALRFKPEIPEEELEGAFRAAGEEQFYRQWTPGREAASSGRGSAAGKAGASPGMRGARPGTAPPSRGSLGNHASPARRMPVWVFDDDGSLKPVLVDLGLTDGVATQIVSGNLAEGQKIVTGVEQPDSGRTDSPAGTRAPGFGGPGFGRRIR